MNYIKLPSDLLPMSLESTKKLQRLPLEGVMVLEFCQYLSGPSAGLRLADLGARVIKIENPGKGDLCRILPIKNQWIEESSLLFHTINRNKESYTANLKSATELADIKKLIKKADVMMHNFRPGVMEKLGLDYGSVSAVNPGLVFAEISGYGAEGPWARKPGQDLLLQAMSGLMYASGNQLDGPMPFGLAIGDMLCGAQAVQGILAALVHRKRTGKGSKISLSLLESLLDMQFEVLTTYFASGKRPLRSAVNGAHALLGAPYGIYCTKDSHLAIAMIPILSLREALGCAGLDPYDQSMVFSHRDEIKQVLADFLKTETTSYWLEKLRKSGLWAMDVKDWKRLKESDGYRHAALEQSLKLTNGQSIKTNRCPIRIDGKVLFSEKPAPGLGEHTALIKEEFK
ncbi:CaiB/BaiF CoA transferase family protein [Echinicola rosea]|uniref:CoA transferase n=1 Tax=Echinicola rosea TaxID=1807691 RepID=A0ABQ1UPN1_9BACT|nr:CaiB/BaiF CoA-transferase family protein [Echinicola rosea]GGF23506.1 CoA transferase [Echinicola rosea]